MFLGVDYYPEQWNESMIDEDLNRIMESGANTIRIGEFAWHLMEKEEGQFDFSYFDKVIEKAKNKSLKIIFGTPTATFPAWLYKKYPSLLSKDEKGIVRAFGGRRQYCFNSNIYRAYAAKITSRLVAHYRNEEEIVAWQVDNEFGHEGSDLCFCEICHDKFQYFLESKYQDINQLNETYGTIFWGQTYNEFSEIPMPIPTITTHNPSLLLDWARFKSESVNDFAKVMIGAVKLNKGAHQLVTHNFFGGFFNLNYDQNIMSELLDVVSYDNYPVWGGLEAPLEPFHIAMTHDYMRGLKNQNYWILEELMGAQGHTEIGYLPRPNQAKLWAFQAMAKGCESLMFFRWRTMTRGQEQFCQGIIDVDNRDNRKLKEVKDFFEVALNYEGYFKTPVKAEVAILYDYCNGRSWYFQPQNKQFNFTDELLRIYEGFHHLNVPMDVISVSKDFANYKVVVLPVMQIVDKELKKKLEFFVENGGTILFTFRSGIKDQNNNLYFGGCDGIGDLCGIEIPEYESLPPDHKIIIKGQGIFNGKTGSAGVWRDLIKPNTAEILFSYEDIHYGEYAAVTENFVKDGKVLYVGCGIDLPCARELAKYIVKGSSLNYEETPDGLEIVVREHSIGKIKILLNHNDQQINYKDIRMEPFEVLIQTL